MFPLLLDEIQPLLEAEDAMLLYLGEDLCALYADRPFPEVVDAILSKGHWSCRIGPRLTKLSRSPRDWASQGRGKTALEAFQQALEAWRNRERRPRTKGLHISLKDIDI